MVGYTTVENAILNKLLSVFSEELDATRCKAGDIDGVLQAMFDSGEVYGCYIDYSGGSEDTRKPFSTPVWVWKTVCVFLIRYGDGIETKLRTVIDKTALLFHGDHTIGGVVPLARISSLGDADIMEVADTPFYWLPFIIETIDRNTGD